ncbi:MAG: hypothetical protein GY898_05355 [Proteobacteria bacterium]|nr:hypothetical protein [Pseudomonadota bacterium]
MRSDRTALILAVLVAVIGLCRFEGPAEGYWDTYITAPAMHVAGHGIDFVLRDGTHLVEYELQGALPDDLVDPDTFGIITKDQRLGAGMTSAPEFVLFGKAGFRLLFALCSGLVMLGGYLFGREVFGPRWPALAVGLVIALNPYTLAVNRLNPNQFALVGGVLLCAVLARLLRTHSTALGPAIVAGLLFGAIGNIRPEAVVATPAFLWGLGATKEGRWKRLAVGCATAAIAVFPTLVWNSYALGNPLMHSSQYAEFQGFRPTFPHRFLGTTFEFNGLLNWPFHTEVVRTPHFPLPVFLLVPAQFLLTWGAVLIAAAGMGAWSLVTDPERRSHGLLMLGWGIPTFLLLLPHENWDELKMTYALLTYPALGLAAAAGLEVLVEAAQAKKARPLLIGAGLVVLLVVGCRSLGSVDVPLDDRWYTRFPGAAANGSGIELLTDDLRRDWEFFHTVETPEEIAIERTRFGRGNLLPNRYWEREPSWTDGLGRLGSELGDRELRLLAVWYYIYGGERDDVTVEPGGTP